MTMRRLAAERAMARKAAASRPRTRKYWVVGMIAAVVVVIAVVLGAALLSGDDEDDEGEFGQAVPDQGREHIVAGQEHDPYNSAPPTSGPHIGNRVAPWGVSAEPIADEVQVHNLEHGGVMLQYNCDCPEAITLLQRFADPATGYPTKLIAAPYPDMETEIALTAWGRIWTMPAAELTADRLRAFVDRYVDRGPEIIPSERQVLEDWRESDVPKP